MLLVRAVAELVAYKIQIGADGGASGYMEWKAFLPKTMVDAFVFNIYLLFISVIGKYIKYQVIGIEIYLNLNFLNKS